MSQHLYQFCPRCAHALEDRPFEGKLRRTCPACGFIYFPDPKVAVVALVEANARVLLIRRAVNPGRGLWALPGGYMDAGELPDAALRREVLEEAGIEIVVGELLEIFPMVNGDGRTPGIVLAFHAHPRDPLAAPIAHDDAEAVAWFSAAEAPSALAFDSTQRLLARWRARVQSP
ncbi:MAG TPA: NUDIX hydrolase [Chloroflexi bacterium]|nr:NUDIX hydrolase [Chloroflexota bacterium]